MDKYRGVVIIDPRMSTAKDPLSNTTAPVLPDTTGGQEARPYKHPTKALDSRPKDAAGDSEEEDTFHDAEDARPSKRVSSIPVEGSNVLSERRTAPSNGENVKTSQQGSPSQPTSSISEDASRLSRSDSIGKPDGTDTGRATSPKDVEDGEVKEDATVEKQEQRVSTSARSSSVKKEGRRSAGGPAVSEWSHQRLAAQPEPEEEDEEEDWKAMPALGQYDLYDDDGRLVAKASKGDDNFTYAELGGAGKGYTRVQLDEDAQSATSLDEDTKYLFKEGTSNSLQADDDQRDVLAQLQATKTLLTEGQRIAYVGVTRLTTYNMVKELGSTERTKATKKVLSRATESMEKWGQQMMVRLYAHMDIEAAEQLMIEQLAEHGVQPADLVPPLMQNSRVNNPMAQTKSQDKKTSPESQSISNGHTSMTAEKPEKLPLQEAEDGEEVPELQAPEDIPRSEKLDLDLRWTVLCDLFLVLISDSVYDARSRLLLERVAAAMNISWIQICRFEKRVIDALEMQEEASKESWNEEDHIEERRKKGLRRKYMVMGLATVGGGLVIGLSAGLLAPVIGAGLAAGFTTIGVTGTAGFLGGVGGAALITSAATATGGTIAIRASNRRTGHVKTFEYRPLHNNKRLNLVLSVSGWMNGKIDDVRLPFSTVDPIMGDIYSLLWEPEMLQSMGDTINILATEALTQTVQQVLGSTVLVALMASIQLPVVLTKLSYLIDNPWTVSLDRANAAGLILADSLIDRHLGQRPVTLLGFSLGSRLIFSCLKELAHRGAYGLVQNVYLFGSPIVANKDEYLRARSVISGRFVNGYSTSDWVLGYLFRLTSGGIMRIAGLTPVEGIPGLENVDVTTLVRGHMSYRTAMPRLLREVGWEVESDEFTEIEDPDPENHAKRQRELIQEIDDARKKAEENPLKKRFGIFKRGRLAEKKGWETYDLTQQRTSNNSETQSLEPNVLFDIEAIRRELESEFIEVRELDSTLPPMQISTLANGEKRSEPMPLPPSDLKPEEIAALNLPPRPHEIDDDPAILPVANGTKRDPSTDERPDPETDVDFSVPRELVTTLPPLTLSPSQHQEPYFQPISNRSSRSPSHVSTPRQSAQRTTTSPTRSTTDIASPIEALNLEHNAWADDDVDEFGQRKGGVMMTFE